MERIVFASCTRVEAFPDQEAWRRALASDPDLLLLLGDQIYMDFGILPPEANGTPKGYTPAEFRGHMERKYQAQWAQPDFRALFEHARARRGVFGVWDDHDFAWNNSYGNADYEGAVPADIQAISRECLNRWFYGAPTQAPVYRAVTTLLARIVLLDTRTFAGPPGDDHALLGEAQWTFLAAQLEHDRPYTVICAGITMTQSSWSWRHYEKEYERLGRLLQDKPRVLFLGGDIHENAFDPSGARRPCHEAVSSGAAMNKLGLPLPFDDRRNWGLLELDDGGVTVSLHDKRGLEERWRIERTTWLAARLD